MADHWAHLVSGYLATGRGQSLVEKVAVNTGIWKAIGLVLAVLGLIGIGYLWGADDVGKDFAEYREDQTRLLNDAYQAARDTEKEYRKSMAALAKRSAERLQEVRDERDRLQHGIATGRYRVYVAASCPDGAGDAQSGSVGNGAPARLDPGLEQTYLDFRADIKRQREQVIYLQGVVRQYEEACSR